MRRRIALNLKILRYSESTAKEMYQLLKNRLCSEGKINSVLTRWECVKVIHPHSLGEERLFCSGCCVNSEQSEMNWHDNLRR